MNKHDLIEAIAADPALDHATAEAALAAVLQAITSALAAGDKVAIPGFGTFETRSRAARVGRHPQTGEPMEIAAGTTAGFKPAAALKQAVGAGR